MSANPDVDRYGSFRSSILLGSRTLVKRLDVADAEAVSVFAREIVDTYGKIDVWVNNAAVALFGKFDEIPYEDCRRLLETNLFGYIHGARSALSCFRQQRHGILVNISSVAGKAGQPYTSMYVTSKFAINGLSECLRMEVLDAPDIHVCTVLPAFIDTPLFQHAGNFSGRAVRPMTPIYPPEKVAEAVMKLVEHPRREQVVGNAGWALLLLRNLAPPLSEKLVAQQVEKHHLLELHAEPTHGNLFEPMEPLRTTGGWRSSESRRSDSKFAEIGIAVLGAGYLAWRFFR